MRVVKQLRDVGCREDTVTNRRSTKRGFVRARRLTRRTVTTLECTSGEKEICVVLRRFEGDLCDDNSW